MRPSLDARRKPSLAAAELQLAARAAAAAVECGLLAFGDACDGRSREARWAASARASMAKRVRRHRSPPALTPPRRWASSSGPPAESTNFHRSEKGAALAKGSVRLCQDPYKSLILINWRGNMRSVFLFSRCLNSLPPPLTMSAILRDVSNIARSPCAAKAKVSTPARVSPQPLPPPRWALDDFEIGAPVGGQNQGSSRRIAWEAA